jgi:tetratricopeptide (TPR) repeat protein
MAALGLFARFEEEGARRPWRLAGALALLALGMLSKSVVVAFPAGAAIWIWYRRGTLPRRDRLPLLMLFGAAAAFALFDMTMVHRIDRANFGYSHVQRLLLASRALAFYLGKLVWPLDLNIIYRHWTVDPGRALDWIFPAGCAGLLGGLFLLRRRIGRGPLACMLFYAATLAPMLGLVDFAFLEIAPVADRFQYLASIGPCILAGAAAERWLFASRRNARRVAGRAAFAVLLIVLGGLTWRQAGLYRDLQTLFQAAVDRNPESPHAHANLGAAFAEAGRPGDAGEQFRIALALKPGYLLARSNLGAVLAKQGDIAGAVREYRAIAEADPDWLGPVNDLAWYLATSDDPSIRNPVEALKWARLAAAKTSSGDPSILDTLAAAQAAAGDPAAAARTAARALLLARAAADRELAGQIRFRLDGYLRAAK